jgi:3-hydroxyacyl-CoA dehydrogenase/sugar lactone lactonase YvrE
MSYDKVQRVAIVGTGVIGASWAAYFLARGLDVVATDPAPNAESQLRKYVDDAWPALAHTGVADGASRDRLIFTPNLRQAVATADFVQENGPERPEIKIKLFAEIDQAAPAESILASSSSSITMDVIPSECKHPERCVIGHPFNPPHIVPLVEVVGGKQTSQSALDDAMTFYASIGKRPIQLRRALPGHAANRLQAALYKEVLYLIQQGVLSVADADTAVSYGPGLRWGIMGPSLQWHLGGGHGGIDHFAEHLLDPLVRLMHGLEMPDITADLKQSIINGVLQEAAGRPVAQLVQDEDEVMLGLLSLRAETEARRATVTHTNPATPGSNSHAVAGRIFFLDLGGGRVLSAHPDGSNLESIVEEGRRLPDGLAVDLAAGHLYWTNMGNPKANDGSILRSNLDGRNMTTIVPPGGTFTPKQIVLEKKSAKLYWCDREGMRVLRADLDGSNVETLVDTSEGDARPGPDPTKWCVGVALDPEMGKIYWSQKGGDNANEGRIFRANIEVPHSQTSATRQDIELFYDRLPEPIDLDIDPATRTLYWTDRGDPPRGNSVNRAPLDAPANRRPAPDIVFSHLMEGIGLALDHRDHRMFITDFGGNVYSANLDGSNPRVLLVAQGNLSGIAYAELPAEVS